MFRLAASTARHRAAALVAVVCAVLGGAALLTATGVLAESGLRSQLPAGRLAGADVVVSADQTVRPPGDLPVPLPERRAIPADLVDRLGRLPGASAAVGDVSFPAAVLGAAGTVLPVGDPATAGHGWSSTRLLDGLQLDGRPPTGPDELAVDAATAAAGGVRPGDRVRAVLAGRPGTYRVTAVVRPAGAGILVADATAARLAGRDSGPRAGTVDLVGLRAAPGAAGSLAAAARAELSGSGLVVATGSGRGEVAAPGVAAARTVLVLIASSLAGVTVLVIGFAIAGAVSVSVAAQRRDLALMRAVGATPRQIRALAAGQATLAAAAALPVGVALGYLLAGQFRRVLTEQGVVPAALPLTVGPLPALAAVVLLAGAVQLAARGAAWRASRLPATEAVAESRTEPRTPSRARTAAGLLLLVAAATLSAAPLLSRTLLGAAGTQTAGIVAGLGLALSGPALVRVAADRLARRLPAGVAAPTWLAVANIRGSAVRVGGVVTALAMGVLFVLTYPLAQTTVLAAAARDLGAGTPAQLSVTAGALGGVPADVPAAVGAAPGVRAAVPVGTTTVVWPHSELGDTTVEAEPALILTPDAAAVLDLGVRAGSLADLTGSTVAVSSEAARSRGAGLGSQVELILGDGARVRARVVAVHTRGLGFGPVALSADLAAGHAGTGLPASLLVRTDGTPAAADAVAAVVASRPGLVLATPDGGRGEAPPELSVNLALVAVLLGYLLLSIVTRLVAATAQRRAEVAALRLTGTTPRQVLAMIRREAGLVAGAALATGLALAAVPLALVGVGFLGRPWPAGPVWLLPATAVVVAAVSFLTTELPVRRVLRRSPAAHLGE